MYLTLISLTGESEPQGKGHVSLVFVNHYGTQHKVKCICFCYNSFLPDVPT